jgi:predicted RNase H-like HicB family nuclease
MKKRSSPLYLRVLGYVEEDGLWVAHCLETDLVGQGKTFEKALEHLAELTEMQVSFAIQTNQMHLLSRPAPLEFFEIFARLNSEALRVFPRFPDDKHRTTSIPLDPTNVDPGSFELVGA